MILSERKPILQHQSHSLKKPRPPSNLTRHGAVIEFKKLYPDALCRQKQPETLSDSRKIFQFSTNRRQSLDESEDEKIKHLRFPLLGPTREETSLFSKFQKRKGLKWEETSKEKTVFIPSPLSSPPKSSHHLRKQKRVYSNKVKSKAMAHKSIIKEENNSKEGIETSNTSKDGRTLTTIGRERAQQILFPNLKTMKTIQPSKYGYHPRSHSPSHKQLVQCRAKLDDLIEKKLSQAQKMRDDNPALSLREFYRLYCGEPSTTSRGNKGNYYSGEQYISTEKVLPKLDVLLDSSLIQIRLSLPAVEDLESNQSENNDEEEAKTIVINQKVEQENNNTAFLPQIIIPAPEVDPCDASDDTDESVSTDDISKWETSLKEKMTKVKSTGEAIMVSSVPKQSDQNIPKVSSVTESMSENNKKKKKFSRKKKTKKENNAKVKKEKHIAIENKTIKSQDLIYDKSKAQAVTKVAESHGLTADEANELYLTRDSKLVSQKYLDRLNQLAYGSDESDHDQEYYSDNST